MGIWARFSEHMDLMSRMFAKTGAIDGNLVGGVDSELKNAIFRCNGCEETQACRDWLDGQSELSAPPSFCANSSLIERLRASY